MEYFVKGFIIGLSVAAPVGPIGVLTIRRTLAEGRAAGFATGMGAAAADTLYGAIAGFGLTAVSVFLNEQAFWLRLIGGLFLAYLGMKTFLSKPAAREAQSGSRGLFGHFLSTFFLTVSNPATIFSFLAIFSGLGLASTASDYRSSLVLVLGVFTGSGLWWFFLSLLMNLLRSRITTTHLVWINRASGLLILGFAAWAFIEMWNAGF